MSIITSNQLTGGWLAAERVGHVINAKNPDKKPVDGMTVLTHANAQPNSDLAKYIQKGATEGIPMVAEEFPPFVNMINQQLLVGMFKKDRVSKNVFKTLQTLSIGGESSESGYIANSENIEPRLIESVKKTLHSIDNLNSDRVTKELAIIEFQGQFLDVSMDMAFTDKVFSVAVMMLKSEHEEKLESKQKIETNFENSSNSFTQ